MKTHINPKIITWARQKSGLTVEALAKKMRRDTKEIELWEQGKAEPSYVRLWGQACIIGIWLRGARGTTASF